MIRRLFARDKIDSPSVPPGQRVYAVGDIHGRLDLFDRLLYFIKTDHQGRSPADARIILLGDLIDRGPNSAGVVQRAMEPLDWAQLTAIKGNHEAALLDTLDGDRTMVPIWLGNGGRAALRSWGVDETVIRQGTIEEIIEATRAVITPAERSWISRTRQYLQIGDYFFVHAGVRPGVELDRQAVQDSLWIRDDFLDSKRSHGAVVVHGHSVSTDVEERTNRIGIDTGAYATGRLTALCLERSARWYVQT